jgi:hypothetical protein
MTPDARQPEPPAPDLVRDTRAVAFVEYLILLTVVTMVGGAAVYSVGVPMLQHFRFAQVVVALPFP